MSNKRLSRFGLIVPELSKALGFYRQLGFTKQREIEAPGMKIAFVSLGEQVLELIEKTADIPFHRDGVLNHMTFDVADMEEAVKEFTEAGTTFFVKPAPIGSSYFAFGIGVSGEIIELFQS